MLVALALLLSGCTPSHHRRSADNAAYRIVQRVEQQIFGRTNAFSIETRYSSRKPAEILAAELIEDRLQTNRRIITVEEALRLAVSHSREYQEAKENLYRAALSLTGAKHAFTPQFFASSEARFDRDFTEVAHRRTVVRTNVVGTNVTILTNVSTRIGIDDKTVGSLRSEVSVSKLFKSGGSFTVTLANDILNDLFLYYTGDPQRSIVSTISVNLFQPLLTGFGRNAAAVEGLTQASRDVIYAVRDHAFFQDEFAVGIVNDYFSLLSRKDTIRNNYANYLSRVAATQRLEAREDREQQSAVDQTRQAELSAKNTYVNSVADYFTALDEFKITLGLPLGERIFLDDSALTQVRETGLVPASLNPIEAYRVAVKQRLPLLNAIDQFEDSKRKVRIFADALKPGLDFFADASLESEKPTDYTKFDPNKIRAGVGLRLDLPLDRLNERNDYRASLISFELELRQLTLEFDRLRDRIDEGLRTLEQRRQSYFIQTNALALANRRVESSTILLQAGRAEARDLIEAQDAQLRAQNDVTRALVGYQEARLQLMLGIGALDRSKSQFWLKDHLAGFAPGAVATAVQPDAAEKPVVPPDQLFNN